MTQNETDNFKAFDLVASALEELELYEASVKAHEAEEEKDSRMKVSANGENFAATSEQWALDNARRYLGDALNKTSGTSIEDQDPSRKDHQPRGDEEYFKAHYLAAMTEYFSGQPTAAVDLFERILNPPQAPDTSAHRAAKKARETADKAFVEEVRYNLGAAYFEAGKLKEAISQFEDVIQKAGSDLSLELLARAGKALAHAKYWQQRRDKGDSNKAWEEIRKTKRTLLKDAVFLFRIAWRNGFIIRKRKIDRQTAHSIVRIIATARHELDSKESPTVVGAG